MRNIFLIMIALIMVISLSSAVIEELPDTIKLNDCANLIQVDNVLTQNITSILKPNAIETLNVVMEKDGTFFNYTYCDNDVTGSYTVNGVDNNGTVWAYDYLVTPSGEELSMGSSITLIGSLIMMIIVSGLFFYLGSKSDSNIQKLVWFSVATIFFIMVVLYTVIIIQQTLFGFDSIISATETFWFVVKIGMTIGIVAFFIIIFLIMLKYWKIKRGLID